MKKLVVILMLLVSCVTASAEFRWGPTAGVNISTLHWKQDLVTTKYLCGPNAGIMGEIMIPGIGFGIDLGLRYSMMGAKVNFGEREIWSSEGMGNENVYFQTIQIPLNLRFKWTRMNGAERYAAPFVYVGPLFNFNVAMSKVDCLEYPAGSVGLQCGIGGEFFERFQLSAGYYWGLSYNCRTYKLDNFSAQNRSWQINVAVLF